MIDKDFFCTMYNSNLVERAIADSEAMYGRDNAETLMRIANSTEMLMNMATSTEMHPEDMNNGVDVIYSAVQRQMVSSYLRGASYAVLAELASTEPSEETFSEFHKNVDFAILFDFADNDFSIGMEAGAKAYCDDFNNILGKIDMYDDCDSMKPSYIKEFEDVCKIENIKEIMKCGFLSQQMKCCSKVLCGRMPNAISALETIKSKLEYIPWDGYKTLWEKVGEKYVEIGKFPRFITGTKDEIAEAIKKYGHPDENPTREFPVWCNGEVIILYIKDGYLTYLTR